MWPLLSFHYIYGLPLGVQVQVKVSDLMKNIGLVPFHNTLLY